MSSGFISEKELAEARLKRQEEWEKVRTADSPLEAPEREYDSRNLYERLEEQRKQRDLEFEESRKLKNMIKGLDDDEIDFLDLVDQKKLEAERNKSLDEERELLDYRNRVANLQEQSKEQRLQAEIKGVVKKNSVNQRNSRLSQNQLLKGGLVIKKNDSQIRKRKLSECDQDDNADKEKKSRNDSVTTNDDTLSTKITNDTDVTNGKVNCNNETVTKKGMNVVTTNEPVLKCIGILPGLGYYTGNSSSDSDAESSDIEEVVYEKVQYDITGRKIEEKDKDDDS